MHKLLKITAHTTFILALMFSVFLVLDLFNPTMDFAHNAVSRALLTLLCLSGMLESVALWSAQKRRKAK